MFPIYVVTIAFWIVVEIYSGNNRYAWCVDLL